MRTTAQDTEVGRRSEPCRPGTLRLQLQRSLSDGDRCHCSLSASAQARSAATAVSALPRRPKALPLQPQRFQRRRPAQGRFEGARGYL